MKTNCNYIYRSSQDWEEIFKLFESSNLSRAAFCREHDIKPSTFADRYRRHKLVSKAEADEIIDFIPVTVAPTSSPKTVAESSLTITIGKASISITPDVDVALLKTVASTLAEMC